MIDDLISELIYREEKNSQKREAEKTGSRAWPKVSQVDEEATEGMEMGREMEIFPRSKGRQLGPSMCLVCSLPSSLGLPAWNPSYRWSWLRAYGNQNTLLSVSFSFLSWCFNINLETASQRKYSPWGCLWSTSLWLKENLSIVHALLCICPNP